MHVLRSAPFAMLITTLLCFLTSARVRAQNTAFSPAASTFYLQDERTQFSINIANDSSDVYFHLSSPAYSWLGVGFGSKMEDSLMLIVYPDEDGSNVTISPRIGRQAGEPVFTNTVSIELLSGTGITNRTMTLNARCKDCRVWPHGYLDATSPEQDMIFAFGEHAVHSSSPAADLKRHARYGSFTMDLQAATGVGGVPRPRTEGRGVVMGGVGTDRDGKGLAHALLGCLVLFVMWPVNVLIAGFVRRRCWHVGFAGVALVGLGVVYGLGFATSGVYNRTKAFNTPHQILALIALAPLLLTLLLPIPKISSLHRQIPLLHAPLSTVTLILLLISGGLGLHLSQQSRTLVLIYTALSLLLVIFLAIIHAIIRRRGSAHAHATIRLPIGSMSSSELGLLRRESKGSEGGSVASLKGFLEESRRDEGRRGGDVTGVGLGIGTGEERKGKLFGGGTMPGPQYLLNMHPGVRVHIGSGRRI